MKPVDRARGVAHRARVATGFSEVGELAVRVDALAEAIAENRQLEEPLVRRVAELQRQLVPLLELRHRT